MPNLVNPFLFAPPPAGGEPFIESVSSVTHTASGTSFSVPLPSSYAAGDLLLAFLMTESTFDASATISGWTNEYYAASRGGDSASFYSSITVLSKVASSSESSPTITTPISAADTKTFMIAVRDWGSFGNANNDFSTLTSLATFDSPSVTTLADDALVIYALCSRRGDVGSSTYSTDVYSPFSPEPNMALASNSQATAGASPVCTWTAGANNFSRPTAISFVIEP